MIHNWIPRNLRWSADERKQKETQARNARENARKIWLEKEKMRREIEREILPKVLAKRSILE
jgi:hypothetical protein